MTTYKSIYDKVPLRDRPLVKSIRVKLEYTRSGNVKGKAWIRYKNDGESDFTDKLKAEGWGYDKMGALIEGVLNIYARQNLLDYDFDSKKNYRGVLIQNGEPYYYNIDSTGNGHYFNFDMDETASFKNGDIAQFDIKFKNAMLDKFYGYKTIAPKGVSFKKATYGKHEQKDVIGQLEHAYKKML